MTQHPQQGPTGPTHRLAFLTGRFRPHGAFGLVLTLELAVLVALGAAFGGLTEEVLDRNELVGIDNPVARYFTGLRSPGLTSVMTAITSLGTGWVLVPVALVVGLLAARRVRSARPVVLLVVVLAGSTVMAQLIKVLVARPRPSGALVTELGYAFPSGHSTAAAAGWLGVALVVVPLTRRAALRVATVTVAVLLVVLVGLSRIYLGVHAATDVLGGWALGAGWVAATWAAFRVYDGRRAEPDRRPSVPQR